MYPVTAYVEGVVIPHPLFRLGRKKYGLNLSENKQKRTPIIGGLEAVHHAGVAYVHKCKGEVLLPFEMEI